MIVPFSDLKRQYENLRPAMDLAIQSVLDRTAFVGGAEIAAFEAAFSPYCGGAEVCGCANGTDAIELALLALGIGPGDEVIIPALTFMATAEPVALVGAKPVVVDIDPLTYTIAPDAVAAAVSSRTKAIIPVHIYGQTADMDAIQAIADTHGLHVIEDCAQAHGAEYRGRRAGGLADMATFSFYPGKNLGAFGDAGAVASRDPALMEKVRLLRDHGHPPKDKFSHRIIGRNSRMDTLQAAVLGVKLPYLEGWTEKRRFIAARYDQGLAEVVTIPVVADYARPVYHLYVIQCDDREGLRDRLQERGVASGLHYPRPIHLQDCLREAYGYQDGMCPEAERICGRILSLPIFAEMTEAQVQHVIESVRQAWR